MAKMKAAEQDQALYLLKLAEATIAELLPLVSDRLNTDEKSLKLTHNDVSRMIKRINDFRIDHS